MLNGSRQNISPGTRRLRRGQTLTEFALTLPILLMLIFGIIEFGRIFQAWVTIQNAARTAARYGITGQYNQVLYPDTTMNEPWRPDSGVYGTGLPPSATVNDGIPCQITDTRSGFRPGGVTSGMDNFKYGTGNASDPNDESFFASHWNGKNCNPGIDEDMWMRKDILRLVSMTQAARVGAAGLALAPWMRIPGTGIDSEPGGDASLMPGWFHVFVCSSRPSLPALQEEDPQWEDTARVNADPPLSRYDNKLSNVTTSTNKSGYGFGAEGIRLCTIEEIIKPDGSTDMNALNNYATLDERQGVDQYDAGGPGDFVEVVVYFNHPLITPLGLGRNDGQGPYIQLQARRTMINESFRTARVLELPNQGYASPTLAPPGSATNTYTPSPTLSPTASMTRTASPTPSTTNTPTATPQCTALSWAGAPVITGQFIQLPIRNDNPGPVYVQSVQLNWMVDPLYPKIYPNTMGFLGRGVTHWTRQSPAPPPAPNDIIQASTVGWNGSTSATSVTGGGATSTWQAHMVNGPTDLTKIYAPTTFGQITIVLYWPYPNGTNTCQLSFGNPPNPPNRPPDVCGTGIQASNFALTFQTFQQYGVVRFQFSNNDPRGPNARPVSIVGFTLNWKHYFPGLNLGRVAAKGTTPFSPDTIDMWYRSPGIEDPPTWTDSQDQSPNTGWLTSASFDPSTSGAFWVDFQGTNGNLQADFPGQVFVSDFNGSSVRLSNGCVVQIPDAATPIATATATPTPSNTPTPTATNTNTATNTSTPSHTSTITDTPSKTASSTITLTPSTTLTPSRTPSRTPSITWTPSRTPSLTWTPSITLTPSITPSRTPSFTASPITPSKTPSNTPKPPTNTSTFTASPITPSKTPSLTPLPSNTLTKTPSLTPSLTPIPSNTLTKTPSLTPSFTPSKTPSLTPSYTPSKTNTPTVTSTWTPSFTPPPSNTPNPPILGITSPGCKTAADGSGTVSYTITNTGGNMTSSLTFKATYIDKNGVTQTYQQNFTLVSGGSTVYTVTSVGINNRSVSVTIGPPNYGASIAPQLCYPGAPGE